MTTNGRDIPTTPEPIAIVGSGCRFPGGASSASSLWKLLQTAPDLCREIPIDRFSTTGFYHPDGQRHGTTNVRHSYFLDEDIRLFDAAFFNINAHEAESIDPQQRILLETVYEALEAGGHSLERLRGSDTSVYVGTMTLDYLDTLTRDHNTIPKYFATGINRAIISNRVSYFFDWHGPSMTIDTACSSSLIAVHQGVQALRSGESRVSVACGTQMLLGYDMYIGESNLRMLSPNGRSRMWDINADGYARGEGVAAVVMKRLSDAIADGDHIECIIRETGTNQDGFSNGLTVPNSEAQAALIRQTYRKAGLDPEHNATDRPQYFEAHGTGTQAGDPKEAAAIHDVFGRHMDSSDAPLFVGSIKTVIGHLEGAAGLAGLLKASASVQNGFIPANLSFERLNPKIELFYRNLKVPTDLTSWPKLTEGVPRRASVNSFGFGGANAHAIVEAYTPPARPDVESALVSFCPFVFSANTETSLAALLRQYSQILRESLTHQPYNASDLAWTLHSRRSQLSTRVAFPASTIQYLVDSIDAKVASAKDTPIGLRSSNRGVAPRILGIFTGQGAQWPAMGASLIRSSKFVSDKIQQLEDSLSSLPPDHRPVWSLRQEMLADASTSRIAEAALSQPLCTALQIILVDLLREAGIACASVVGHSSGEIGAAYAAGILTAHDAIRVAYYRGFYAKLAGNIKNGQKGAMLAAGLSFSEARKLVNKDVFHGRLAIAAHNSSSSVTLSGDADAIEEVKALLNKDKKFARLLKVDTAYHSHHMLPSGDRYVDALKSCGVNIKASQEKPICLWYSSVTPDTKPMDKDPILNDTYWRDNMANSVLFADAVKNAISGDPDINVVLEIGPHPALKGPASQTIGDVRTEAPPYFGVLSRGRDDIVAFSETLGSIWTKFESQFVDLASFDKCVSAPLHSRELVTGLPSYQWDHGKVHWSESRRSKKIRSRQHPVHELLGVMSPESNSNDTRWLNLLNVSEIAWLEGHKLQGLVVFPAAGYVSMAVEACRVLAGSNDVQLVEINDFSIPKAVTFDKGGDASNVETLVTMTSIERKADQAITAAFSVFAGSAPASGSDHDLELAASATVRIALGAPESAILPFSAEIDDHSMTHIESQLAYSAFSKLGYGYTGPFRSLSSIKRKLNQTSAMVSSHVYSDNEPTIYWVHPSMLDVAFQAAMLAYSYPGDGRLWSLHVPTGIQSIRIDPQACTSLSISGSQLPVAAICEESDEFVANIDILSENGQQCMIQVNELALQPFAPATADEDRSMYSFTRLGLAVPDATEHLIAEDSGYVDAKSVLATVIKQIAYRYPHAKTLEIGDGLQNPFMVYMALKEHGGALPSYTYTETSPDAVQAAADQFRDSSITFRTFDIDQAFDIQGFQSSSYDIIIASNVLQTSSSVDAYLQNVRQLLKPGGYLVLCEQTALGDGSLPGVVNSNPDPKPRRVMRAGAWHSATRNAGFGGIDSMTRQGTGSPFSVMVAQAVDERIKFLRRPLTAPTTPIFIDNLVILCATSVESYRMADELADLLRRFCDEVTIIEGLPGEKESSYVASGSTFINLIDIDEPIFKVVTEQKMVGLKRMFSNAQQILWLTRGVHDGIQPFHSASMAFCRSLANEASHISINTLDISSSTEIVPRIVSEHILRQCALDKWADEPITWSQEPETFEQHGKLFLPRILPHADQNNRINSSRRAIKAKVSVLNSDLSIEPDLSSSMPRLVTSGTVPEFNEIDRSTQLEVMSSSLRAIQLAPGTFLFLALGKLGETPGLAISVTASCSARTTPIRSVPLTKEYQLMEDHALLLVAVTAELLAASILDSISPGSTLLIHCMEHDLALTAALKRQAIVKFVMVHSSCMETTTPDLDPSWLAFSPYASSQTMRCNLASLKITHFLDWTGGAGNIGFKISQALGPACKHMDLRDFARLQASHTSCMDEAHALNIQESVVTAYARACAASKSREILSRDLILDLHHIGERHGSYNATAVISWPTKGDVIAEVRPLKASNIFSDDKSYILFGLTGQIGQSLCEWMVSNGAGTVILTSRNPKVDQKWLHSFESSPGTVKVMAVDITNQGALESLIKDIKLSNLPIGGIVNGANVLSDAPFDKMSAELMNRALGPKITGSYNLDQVFYNDDLEFFILCSSISCVIGTAGQSNYVAANGYMNGLARQRRSRGLAASALDLGLVLGIGVAEVAGQSVIDSLQKYGITPLSELDIRSAFMESIYSGHLTNKQRTTTGYSTAVMTSGLRTITTEERSIVWYNNPIFSHLVVRSGADDAGDPSRGKGANLPAKEQIAAAETMIEALAVLKECTASKLRVLLGSGDDEFPPDAPLVEMGIDSLVAVEVRSWFLKSLQIDIPVLKILDGSSLDTVCEMAIKRLPKDLLAQIGKGSDSDASSENSQVSSDAASTSTTVSSAQLSSAGGVTERENISAIETPATGVTRPTSTVSLAGLARSKFASNSSIVKRHPISIGQSRFWFLRLLVEDPTAFNVTLKFRMHGHVRVGDLERAINAVTARHEALRTCFTEDSDEADQAWQNVLSRSSVNLERKSVASEEDVAAEYDQLRTHQFDLASGPLLRMILVTLSPTSHFLLVNYHHIIMDMASFQVLSAEIDKAYNSQPLGPVSRQYPDFSVEQRRMLDDGEMADEIEYWRGIFPAGSQPPVLPLLPMARSSSRTAMTNYALHQVSILLDADLVAQVKAVSRAQRSTPFHFYLAAFKAMLFAFTDTQDLTIGIADANRQDSDVIGSIGFFLNLLTLKFSRMSKQTFAGAIVEARTTAYGALGHSRLPFDVLLKELNVPRSSSYNPFFQAFFDYRQQTSDRQTWCNCRFDLDQLHPGRTGYDIALDVADLGSNVHLTFRVQKGLYDETAANLLLQTYAHFVTTLSQDVSLVLDEMPLFSERQLAHGIQIGVGPELEKNWPATLPHRIDQMAQLNGTSTALADGYDKKYSYSDMIKRIEAIAEALVNAGVRNGNRVLVFQQATSEWICSLLAIMRIGGVYVPLDLRNPMERLVAQASHCAPAAVLADDDNVKNAPQLAVPVILNVSNIPAYPTNPVPNVAESNQPAAILYTSGSTGTPKGIVIQHSGICNQMEGYTKTYQLGAERVLQQSAFTFDFSLDQIFTGLVNGGMLFVVPSDKRGDPLSITEIMWRQSITYTKVTPSEYSMWMQYGHDNLVKASEWRFAFAGGEPLTKAILRQFSSLDLPYLRLSNSYGPAETSIASHKGFIDYRQESLPSQLSEERTIACGFSLPSYATYILDENQNPLPVGMPGEVVIGGAVFMPNPYANSFLTANGWTKMHRTGDIGHLQDDGSLVFRNRMAGDTQIKLRGLRINLQDIEQNMVSTARGALKDTIVSLRSGDPEYLVAHVVFSPDTGVEDQALFLEQLLSRLPIPPYMMPVMAVPLERLPVTKHAKVDRKAIANLELPQRTPQADDNGDETSEISQTMIQLASIWEDLLPHVKSVGTRLTASTDFFQIGGNSLLVVRLQSRIRQVFNVAVRLVDFINLSTLSEMARKIEESPVVDLIDWEAETAPPAAIGTYESTKTKEKSGLTTVLMTGATGNLAKHVLRVLLSNPTVERVHCIAVRNKDRPSDILSHAKVKVSAGDLSLPLLGLEEGEFTYLAHHVNVILHLGAVRSFWDNYNMLRSTNVHSTKELVKFASVSHIPIHFVSTSAVLSDPLASPSSAMSYSPPPDGSDGYVSSKWACERILERSAASPEVAVPSFIYRLLPSSSTVTPAQKNTALDEFERCMKLADAVPDTTGWQGRMDLIRGEDIATWLCGSIAASTSRATETPANATFLHYECPITISVEDLDERAELFKAGKPQEEATISSMPLLKWMGKIKALGFSYILASQDATVRRGTGELESTKR
ncbi:Acyl transferase domain containing protein [Pyrenophora tritici-repentis]|nr:Acyl transferase domain containing protein [Pyrenophora tritici-repentis]